MPQAFDPSDARFTEATVTMTGIRPVIYPNARITDPHSSHLAVAKLRRGWRPALIRRAIDLIAVSDEPWNDDQLTAMVAALANSEQLPRTDRNVVARTRLNLEDSDYIHRVPPDPGDPAKRLRFLKTRT